MSEEQIIGRVVTEHKASYLVVHDGSTVQASVRGSFHEQDATLFPKVGDYVVLTLLDEDKAVIESVKERKSVITRKSAHDDTVQVMVANVDYIFIVMGLDDDFNLRRLERYILLADQANVAPVIILNKADLANDIEVRRLEVEAVAGAVPIHIISAKHGEGMEIFDTYLTEGVTGVLLGSSGAGKSTITNYLLDHNLQATQGVREGDSRGRHTTTTRELFAIENGAYLIDTPGMRELGFTTEEDDASGAFADIDLLVYDCRFANCDHEKSAGCALIAAVERGELDPKRLESYRKLKAREAETRSARKRD